MIVALALSTLLADEPVAIPAVPPPEAPTEAPPELLYTPTGPQLGRMRFGVGMVLDGLDPAATLGIKAAAPQFVFDGRFGLGAGWSILGRFQTLFVTNELEIGVGWSKSFGNWSVLAGVEGGALFGALGEFGFDAFTASPAVRPVLAIGHAFGDVHASLRGEMVFASPQYVRVGTASNAGPPPDPLAASSLGLIVENPLKSGGIWYFGAAMMAARAYYQVWVLFGDNPSLLVYPRLLGGYVF